MIWYTIPIKEGVSWEGHLSGFIIGAIFALIFNRDIEKPIKYEWEKVTFNEEEDPFLSQFDENGYFFEIEKPIEVEEDQTVNSENCTNSSINFTYQFKPLTKPEE